MIKINAHTLADLESLATQYDLDANELLDEALKLYRRRLEETKIENEKQQFLRQHAHLKERYLGQFVAMHNGQVVDNDINFVSLHHRIRNRFGHQAILLRRVEEEPDRPLIIRSPRVSWNKPS